ncbi:MAG: hypothetical protein JRE40_15125 [Deltaproteobacteria bacterium]|nr:hypothetical protein [Deltaproteobacteria bacterium]
MRRPNKPHIDGFEDEEDCEGYYDPDEADRRRCPIYTYRESSDLNPCKKCIMDWHKKDDARRKAEWDAKTPAEKKAMEKFCEELRKLY